MLFHKIYVFREGRGLKSAKMTCRRPSVSDQSAGGGGTFASVTVTKLVIMLTRITNVRMTVLVPRRRVDGALYNVICDSQRHCAHLSHRATGTVNAPKPRGATDSRDLYSTKELEVVQG